MSVQQQPFELPTPDARHRLQARSDVFKALGHPARLAIVEALAQGEMCVCQMTELVGSDMSTVSKHLAILRNLGIVSMEKRGQQVWYELDMTCAPGFISCVDNFLRNTATRRLDALHGSRP